MTEILIRLIQKRQFLFKIMSTKQTTKKSVNNLKKSQQNLRDKFIKTNDELLKCKALKENYQQMILSQNIENDKLKKDIEQLTMKIEKLNYLKFSFQSNIEKLSEYKCIANSECLNGENLAKKCNTLCKYNIAIQYKHSAYRSIFYR